MDVEFKTPISQLNAEQRKWFSTTIVAMILADGDIATSEADFLVKVIYLVKDPPTVERLKKFIKHRTVPEVGIPKGVDRRTGMLMMVDLARIAVVDSDFDPKERQLLETVGDRLGLSDEETHKVIAIGFDMMRRQSA